MDAVVKKLGIVLILFSKYYIEIHRFNVLPLSYFG